MKSLNFFPVGFLFLFLSLSSQAKNHIRLFANNDSEQVQFAVSEIQISLNEKGQESVVRSVSQLSQLKDDDYNIVLLNIGDKANLQLLGALEINDTENPPLNKQ